MIEKHLYTSDQKFQWFGDGEWIKEPDMVEFTYKNYECTILRICIEQPCSKDFPRFGGYINGYVTIPKEHPYYEKHYDDMEIDCHGGLTFSEISDNKYMIGFDCAHSGDYVPSMQKFKKENQEMIDLRKRFPIREGFDKFGLFNPTYKNMDFCVKECKSIVDQLIDIPKE